MASGSPIFLCEQPATTKPHEHSCDPDQVVHCTSLFPPFPRPPPISTRRSVGNVSPCSGLHQSSAARLAEPRLHVPAAGPCPISDNGQIHSDRCQAARDDLNHVAVKGFRRTREWKKCSVIDTVIVYSYERNTIHLAMSRLLSSRPKCVPIKSTQRRRVRRRLAHQSVSKKINCIFVKSCRGEPSSKELKTTKSWWWCCRRSWVAWECSSSRRHW